MPDGDGPARCPRWALARTRPQRTRCPSAPFGVVRIADSGPWCSGRAATSRCSSRPLPSIHRSFGLSNTSRSIVDFPSPEYDLSSLPAADTANRQRVRSGGACVDRLLHHQRGAPAQGIDRTRLVGAARQVEQRHAVSGEVPVQRARWRGSGRRARVGACAVRPRLANDGHPIVSVDHRRLGSCRRVADLQQELARRRRSSDRA